ncbi:pseudouridylate synthase [Nitzschia inconspicua]|uniref:tRNA pseudouridine(55) synthase n=1 Tax=Nitzschia inconspicua TaxID=303405 RepID=A0A9K3PFX1_9STRA|nr:pseudouridylate synthase [Nitzschia inconspicua]
MDSIPSHQQQEENYFICVRCQKYLRIDEERQTQNDEESSFTICCCVCLGLWQSDGKERLRSALEAACERYGGIASNRFACLPNHGPTATLAGDVCIRYRYFAERESKRNNNNNNNNHRKATDFATYQVDLKRHIYRQIDAIVKEARNDSVGDEKGADWDWEELNPKATSEEQGYLSTHILCLPPRDAPVLIMDEAVKGNNNKKRRKHHRQRPFTTQGGDPRVNLEARLESKGYHWTTSTEAEAMSVSTIVNQSKIQDTPVLAMEYHVIVFRRPMFLYGYYTKSRRDVSQTPFVVMRDGGNAPISNTCSNPQQESSFSPPTNPTKKQKKTAETLGVTSVEEQICGPIEEMLGVSTLNNPPPNKQHGNDHQHGNNSADPSHGNQSGTLYGMIKFHGSGREDMDVRMLVRSDSPTCRGRPFCVQIIDAFRPISRKEQLISLMHTINHTIVDNTVADVTCCPSTQNPLAISYGKNPLGVGISPDNFQMVPADVFSGLQHSTESKVKHYGCYCWSKNALPHENLHHVLFGSLSFPLTIQQKTPIRVLHRRSNIIRERQILNATATRLDDHHFWLSLTTSAGTYVKEFVYGDLGRTQPSISSLMGCRTCLLELDCEGIEMPETDD